MQLSGYWLLRAEEARAKAEDMHDRFAKQAMMQVVAIYGKLAAHARSQEERAKAGFVTRALADIRISLLPVLAEKPVPPWH
jgi:hypothetical protein